MKNKKLLLLISVLLMAFFLSGCSTPVDADGNVVFITLDTPFSSMFDEGVFTAILVYPLAQAINFLSTKVGVGLGIMIVTVVLNALILAVSFKQNVSMQRMQELQPELQKIQRKYEGRDDQASQMRMSNEMQALYKKYDVNPLGSLVISFVQLPILVSMYNAVRRSYAVANGTFMGVSLKLTPMEAFKDKVAVCIVIYLLMVLFQFLSIRIVSLLAELKAKKEAEKRHKHYEKPEQNVVMTYSMLIMIAVVMLNWPTALSLYYLIYSLVTIVKTLVINYMTEKKAA